MIIISIFYRKKKEIIIVSIILILLILTIFYWLNLKKNNKKVIKKDKEVVQKLEKKEEKEIEKTVKVDIKGEINNPGIYELDESKRVIDVIELAGGLTNNADTSVINLSKKLKDEMVIIIYSKYQVKNFETTKEKDKVVQEKCIQENENALKNDACINDDNSKDTNTNQGLININTASLEQLQTLPGVGESKAKSIIEYREKQKFKTIEDIKNVTGIGDSLFAKIKENITT